MKQVISALAGVCLAAWAVTVMSPVYLDAGPEERMSSIKAGGQSAASTSTSASTITVARSGSQPPAAGPAEYFTGTVQVQPLFQATEPSRVAGASVTFEPGARTAWHTHPVGQRLIVTSGAGWVQQWGGPIQEIKPGDVVWIPPGQKHWHGATSATRMTHIALQEHLDGNVVEWLEKVSDDQYRQLSAR